MLVSRTLRLSSSLLRPGARRVISIAHAYSNLGRRAYSFYETERKVSDPLRILFCGSDDFSGIALRALYEEHKYNSDLIRSIDVVVRPAKKIGRGLKSVREVPVKRLAQELKLPIHERDTFTGWNMPTPGGESINLIIAVSFGLFVPPRLLRAAKYGGLNIHPSLLPDLRGPAPIHHALLRGLQHTGVTLQTLSEVTFDAGTVLAQTPPPGIEIPPNCTPAELTEILAPVGPEMLIEGLRNGLHVPPHRDVGWAINRTDGLRTTHAPKITTADKHLNWVFDDSAAIKLVSQAAYAARRERVMGPLWTNALQWHKGRVRPQRMLLEGLEEVPRAEWTHHMRLYAEARDKYGEEPIPEWDEKLAELREGTAELMRVEWLGEGDGDGEGEGSSVVGLPYARGPDGSIQVPFLRLDKNGSPMVDSYLRIKSIRVEGGKSRPAVQAIESFSEVYTEYNENTMEEDEDENHSAEADVSNTNDSSSKRPGGAIGALVSALGKDIKRLWYRFRG